MPIHKIYADRDYVASQLKENIPAKLSELENAGAPVYHTLNDLVGLYVEVAE